jgi:hypothetical protein
MVFNGLFYFVKPMVTKSYIVSVMFNGFFGEVKSG